jgi:hypothetical protein
MRTLLLMLVFALLATWPVLASAQAAQYLDCGARVKAAQTAIDKVTEDLKGMADMPKDQLGHVNTLLGNAKKQFQAAQRTCDKPTGDYDRARAIAMAEASRGSAEAADMLHWQYMKATPEMKGMKSSSNKEGMDMPGMKK